MSAPKGFAAMNPEKQREIASKGGKAAHAKGTAHTWTSEEARAAGRKGFTVMTPEKRKEIASLGGKAAHAKGTERKWTSEEARAAGRKGGRKVSQDREHMAAIGRAGGASKGRG